MKTENCSAQRQRVWTAIREVGTFSLKQLSTDTGVQSTTLHNIVMALVRAGYLSYSPAPNGRKTAFFTVIRDGGIRMPEIDSQGRPRKRPTRQRLWAAIKVMRHFCLPELCLAARTSMQAAQRYCAILVNAGYLKIVRKARQLADYRLVAGRYTGPIAPVPCADGSLYDANLRETVRLPSMEGDAA